MLSLNPRRLCGGGLPIGWVRCDLALLLSPKASPLTPLLAAHTCLPGTPFVRLAVSMTFRKRWPGGAQNVEPSWELPMTSV